MEKDKPSQLGGESYVLRLYRRESEACKQEWIGMLEDPLHGRQWSFRSMEELKAILQAHAQVETTET